MPPESDANTLIGWCLIALGILDGLLGVVVLAPRARSPQQRIILIAAMLSSALMLALLGGAFLLGVLG